MLNINSFNGISVKINGRKSYVTNFGKLDFLLEKGLCGMMDDYLTLKLEFNTIQAYLL